MPSLMYAIRTRSAMSPHPRRKNWEVEPMLAEDYGNTVCRNSNDAQY